MSKRDIFVSIVSYRDPELPHTLAELAARAARPTRIAVGLCVQAALPADTAACSVPVALREAGVLVLHAARHPQQAAGPWEARRCVQQLLRQVESLVFCFFMFWFCFCFCFNFFVFIFIVIFVLSFFFSFFFWLIPIVLS